MSWGNVLKISPYDKLMWEDIVKLNKKDLREEWNRINTGISKELSIFNLSQKLLRDGAAFILKVHPLIQGLPLAAMVPAIRGTGIGPAIKNSVLTISDMMLKWANHRDMKQHGNLKSKITEIQDKLKALPE